MQKIGLICDSRKTKAWNSGKPFQNAIMLYDSMPPGCLVKVVEGNLDDTEAESLHEKEQPEDREVHRVILVDNSAAESGDDSTLTERISMRVKPAIDQRFDGVSKEVLEQDQDKQAFVSFLVKRIMESDNKRELMKELVIPKKRRSKIHSNQRTVTTDHEGTRQRGNVRDL